ncbi:ABC transporter ATP-binding protein [Streptomyces chiangmaiensis]|uniref:ATP-binding cassette domain-containing protein n=1 Tax=Streptomyces chiangmaiensis TaxID=766497 RepID=A0ABU7FIS4_9ACTN|nr:ATP-binding cassette domain-containing protein [Streptomyces chiangmaiensis]MED7823849.1 ATP-binding cassette domain-containing protein [Streptomyces chiangmaiensis]
MIQAIGLTSNPRTDVPPAVDDVSFEAHAGHVTALLGASGAGKTTALRLMLELQPGRGITYFRGRPLHRIAHPQREVGVLLGDVPGHPARTVRGQLRMLCCAAGVPVHHADEVLERVGLVSLGHERLGMLSRGMDRRLGLACALLGDPHTLVVDDPVHGLSAREGRWLHGVLRAHAAQGGTVLFATGDPKEAARTADHVVTLDEGRLVADQTAAEFARTRLRPRVAVRSPHAARLGNLLTKEARAARRSVEVVHEDGNRLSVYGSTCAEVGEAAFRHGILVHQLADEIGDMGPPADADATTAVSPSMKTPEPGDLPASPPPVSVRAAPNPLRPLRYELHRTVGVATTHLVAAAALVASVLVSVFLARIGHTPPHRVTAAWPQELPLPPAALGAGLLGALAFGDEFRHPALSAHRGTVPRRLGLLAAKLVVAGAIALILAVLAVALDFEVLTVVFGGEVARVPADRFALFVSWCGLVVGCAWAGVLAAGIFRSTIAGVVVVLAVPVLVVPVLQQVLERPSVGTTAGLVARVRGLSPLQWPLGGERYLAAAVHVVAQPVGGALALSLTALLCAYLLTVLRGGAR